MNTIVCCPTVDGVVVHVASRGKGGSSLDAAKAFTSYFQRRKPQYSLSRVLRVRDRPLSQ